MKGRRALAAAFIRAANTYWLSVYPCLCRELRYWREEAEAIPDPILRQTALQAQRLKLGNIEGAAAFAAFTDPATRVSAMRAMACYETAFDYLDCLCEAPSNDPIANGRQLSQALITAVSPYADHANYYAHHPRSADNRYLWKLVEACRRSLNLLPSYSCVSNAAQRASLRIAGYQSLNHGDRHGSYQDFERWAIEQAFHYKAQFSDDLAWWELAASAGSSLGVFALIAAAANPTTEAKDADAIEQAYFPWIGAANSLLDSLIDQVEDAAAPGQHSLLNYYQSLDHASMRLTFILDEAVRRADGLGDNQSHLLTLAAMVSFYLSAPEASTRDMRERAKPMRATLGMLNKPTMLVMSARRAATQILL